MESPRVQIQNLYFTPLPQTKSHPHSIQPLMIAFLHRICQATVPILHQYPTMILFYRFQGLATVAPTTSLPLEGAVRHLSAPHPRRPRRGGGPSGRARNLKWNQLTERMLWSSARLCRCSKGPCLDLKNRAHPSQPCTEYGKCADLDGHHNS